MVKIVLIALCVIASVAMAFPAQNSYDLERIPVRIARAAGPYDPFTRSGTGSQSMANKKTGSNQGNRAQDYGNYQHGSSIGNVRSKANAGNSARN